MPAEFRSNLGAFIGATERGQKAGLIAAAELYMADVKEQLLEGYKGGAFVTGHAANSVQRSSPEATADGVEISIGSDVDYTLWWEVGHENLFTGQHERKEVWVPTMVANRDKYIAAVAAEIKAVDGAL